MNSIRILPLIILLLGTPIMVYAQTTINSIVIGALEVIDLMIPVGVGLAVLLFLWGLAKYILQTDSAEGKESAKNIMIWGTIAIFVIVSMWGLVNLLILITGATAVVPEWPKMEII